MKKILEYMDGGTGFGACMITNERKYVSKKIEILLNFSLAGKEIEKNQDDQMGFNLIAQRLIDSTYLYLDSIADELGVKFNWPVKK